MIAELGELDGYLGMQNATTVLRSRCMRALRVWRASQLFLDYGPRSAAGHDCQRALMDPRGELIGPRAKWLEPDRQADRTDDVTRHRQRHTRHARQCAKLGYCMRMQKTKDRY